MEQQRKYAVQSKPVILIRSGVDWFDGLVSHTQGRESGCPGGVWIVWTGDPGVGKTTAALHVLNSMCADGSVEGWHVDFEQGEVRTAAMYNLHDFSHIKVYRWEPDPTTLLDVIETRAKELAVRGRKLVVLVDSFKAFGESLEEMRAAATRLKSMRESSPNLIVMTVNHKTKGKKTEGPQAIPQWCDVVIEMTQGSGGTTRVATPAKNRWAPEGSPGEFKLKRGTPEEVFVISKEPDFLTDNPVVQFVRSVRMPTIPKWPWGKKEE